MCIGSTAYYCFSNLGLLEIKIPAFIRPTNPQNNLTHYETLRIKKDLCRVYTL